MPFKFKVIKKLTDRQARRLFGWGPDVFEGAQYQLEWRGTEWHCLVCENRSVIAHVGILRHVIEIDGQAVPVAGIGGVVTIPSKQRHGYARLAMSRAAKFIERNLNVSFGLLLCHERLTPFYSNLGWKRIKAPIYIDQPSGEVLAPLPGMFLTFKKKRWPQGGVYLRSYPW